LPFSKTKQILLAIWLLIAAFAGYLITGVVNSRQSTEQRVYDQALSYARLVAEHASAAFDRADNALTGINDHLRPSDLTGAGPLPAARRREIEALLISQQQRSAGIVATFLTRADGRIAAISLREPPGTDLSDRTYFQMLKRERRARSIVSEVVYGRVSKTWGAMVARRIDLPDGRFGGMIGANLGLTQNFSDFYSTLSLGKDSAVSLRDSDNRLLVRYPIAEEKLGKQLMAGSLLSQRMAAGDAEGAVVSASSIDNKERVFGFIKMANHSVYAVVGLSLEDALSPWRQNRNNAAVAVLFIILAGVFITRALRRKERADGELRDLNDSLEARITERTQQLLVANQRLTTEIAERKLAQASISTYADRLQHMSNRMVSLQEEEQRRLARELHDQVSSNLAVVCIDIDQIKEKWPEEVFPGAAERLSECAVLLREIVTGVRDVSSDLHPSILDYAGLIPALEQIGQKFEKRTGILVKLSNPDEDIRLPADKEIALFRIAQEALMNCLKHSDARTVAIALSEMPARVSLSIKDDGRGFDPAEFGLHGKVPGLGLLSMQERALAIGATCRVESARGRGTQVIVDVGKSPPTPRQHQSGAAHANLQPGD